MTRLKEGDEQVFTAFANPNSKNLFKLLVITFCLILSWELVEFTGGTREALTYAFLATIILSAWYWPIPYAILVAVVSGVLCGPLMDQNSFNHVPQPTAAVVVRFVVFVLFAVLFGYLFEHIRQQTSLIRRQGTELIKTLAHTIELRDAYTNGHCERVAKMAVAIGRELGLASTNLLYLEWAALIHDIGKIAIPEELLGKTGKLTNEEFAIVKRHPNLGAWILRETEFGQHLRSGVLHHHERFDGTGYPYGLMGEHIPLQGRIIAVPDVWDAITSERSYRKELTHEDALQIMRDGRGTQFDPAILDIFLRLVETPNGTP